MSSAENYVARLFTWLLFAGVFLTIGGLFLFSTLTQQAEDSSDDPETVVSIPGPDIPRQAAQSTHGVVPDGWMLRPVAPDAGPVSFAEATYEKAVVNLWATWCTPCVKEIPTLQALHASTSDSVSVVLVSQEKKGTVRQFLADKDYDVPVYVTSALPTALEGRGIPRTFIVDGQGRVRYRHVGAANWNTDAVRRLLWRVPDDPS
jgi:thiol-disulfide isomerase/thioredoxin